MNRPSSRLPLAGLAALGIVLCMAAGATGTPVPPLTATAVHISDHAAYVQAVVDFTGPGLTGSAVQATDPNPGDGTAGLLVTASNVATHAPLRNTNGVAIRVVEVPHGLSIGVGSLPGAFKYLLYAVLSSDQLVIDLWKTSFGPAGNIARGAGGCLTLARVSVAPGTVTAAGTAGNLFESRFRVTLRAAGVLGSRAITARGRWAVTFHYTAPQGQGGYLDAAASSAKDGALACLVQKAFALPASNARANLNVVYRAYADVNGDGRRDLVTLRHGIGKGRLSVALARGRQLTAATPSDATWLPGLVASGNVDGRPGEELFLDITHITTSESIAIYTFWHGQLVRAATLAAYGYDYGILSGLTCSAGGGRHYIIEHDFSIKFGTHQWMRQDTVYVWQGPALKRLHGYRATRMAGPPPPGLVGVQCGHPPLLTAAARDLAPRRSALSASADGGRRSVLGRVGVLIPGRRRHGMSRRGGGTSLGCGHRLASTARGGTTSTGRSAIWRSSCETLPSRARTRPSPRAPTTISSASRARATLAMASAGGPPMSSVS